ncbi:MAG TPA: prepilin peptidase [Clostridia bacterium]|nr:prepilin peptidase [Clostridia bacterium]
MLPKLIILTAVLTAAVTGDLLRYRISNIVVVVGLATGFLLNFFTEGPGGLIGSLLGAILPVALLFVLFALRMLGAGDIKLFCAVGAVMGAGFAAYAIVLSFLAGGVAAAAIMIARGNAGKRFAFLGTYLKTAFLTQSFDPYTDFENKNDGAKFHFSPAIAAGCGIQAILVLFKVL